MDVLKMIYITVYFLLTAVILYFVVRLLGAIRKMMKGVDTASEGIGHISENMAAVDEKLGTIRHSGAAWEFFAAWIIIFKIIKETLKNNKDDNLGRSFRKALIHNTRKISSIKL
ncbi:MAG: hypothetical protein IJL85_01810 [Erysipelotrichaceae bacterium]|nr:hypothetical protein [Erysipelotrichaceae bacterium]